MIEHTHNLNSINENSIFLIYSMPYSGFYIKDIVDCFKSNPETKYRIIKDTLVTNNFIDLITAKRFYPTVKIIATVSNPWTRIFRYYLNSLKIKKISLDEFVASIKDTPEYCKNQTDYIFNDNPQGADFILRNEFIDTDFLKFSQLWKCPMVLEKSQEFRYQHKEQFSNESNKIIENIFSRDIENFYSELFSS